MQDIRQPCHPKLKGHYQIRPGRPSLFPSYRIAAGAAGSSCRDVEGRSKLDATTNPCSITMTSRVESSAGEIARGLIQRDGDTVRLIYALPTGQLPASFKTKEKQLMFVMKKMK